MSAICTLTMREIISVTAQHFGVTATEVASPRRSDRLVQARHAAAYLIRELLPRSYPEIGRALGNRDHTSAMHACSCAENRISDDAEYAAKVEGIRSFCLQASSLDRPDKNPFEEAQRILRSPREATGVSIETIRDFAAIAIAALKEATRQEVERARQMASQPELKPVIDPEVAKLRAELAAAKREVEQLVNTPHPLAQPLREWADAQHALETASPAAIRAANKRAGKASTALLLAADRHFNLKRTAK